MISTDSVVDTPRVLLATRDLTLREVRTELLRSFGLHPIASQSAADAIDLMSHIPFDVLILGSTLSTEDCHKIGDAFRMLQPMGRIVEIVPTNREECRTDADAHVVGLDGPLVLRDAVLEQLRAMKRAN